MLSFAGTVQFDLILVGSGFASSFFLQAYLARARADARVLVVERGWRETRQWQVSQRRASRIDHATTFRRRGHPGKTWRFTVAFGGGSNCWWGSTPRLMPADFKLDSLYGVGHDWPISYDDLVPHYERVEETMAISGSADHWPYPRRASHPQPPHRMSDPDRLLAAAYPGLYLPVPTARARVATGQRNACCANGVCGLCPVDAKFTIENGMSAIYADPRVEVRYGHQVLAIETAGGRAIAVVGREDEADRRYTADLIVLGAGALFNVAVLLRSNLPHARLGRGLYEQAGVRAQIDLAGVDNFQGSTVLTGHGYMLYDGAHRREHAACLIESSNRPVLLRPEPGRLRQLLDLKFILEDLPQERNGISLAEDGTPVITFHDYSAYARRGIAAVASQLDRLLAPLPVERIVFTPEPEPTESHLLGGVVMGTDPATSLVDRHLVHHQVRNLVVLGGSAFPTSSPANPTLTISALALWSAQHLVA